MGFAARLLGKSKKQRGLSQNAKGDTSKQKAGQAQKHDSSPPTELQGVAEFLALLKSHIERMCHSPEIRAFANKYLTNVTINSLAANAWQKMLLTRSDGQRHSYGFTSSPVYYSITVLPVELHEAQQWFVQNYGGYTGYLEKAWRSPLVQMSDCSVWCHVICGWQKQECWIQMAICSFKQPAAVKVAIMPIEILTAEERQLMGI